MFDVYFPSDTLDIVFPAAGDFDVLLDQPMFDVVLGLDGRRGESGEDAHLAAVLMCQGVPGPSLNLGPYSPPPGGEQTFTTGIIVALSAPTADWIATIWRNSTLVGSATILAGQTVGVVDLGGGFTVVSPEYVNAVCPVVVDQTIQSPSITLGTA